jgi:predicted ATPase with chaperone activity
MRQQTLVEVQGSAGMGERQYIFGLTEKGQRRAAESVERNQYVGPAPVPYETYLEVQAQQSIDLMTVSREDVQAALAALVLPETVIDSIGAALTSSRSMLVYGESGNGKSSITTAMRAMMPGEVLVPYALDVGGQIVRVLDPRVHERVGEDSPAERRDSNGANPINVSSDRRRDKRFAVCRRPVVTVGGELQLEDLELRYSASGKFYVAPPQVKANGGILVVEDFGRQIVQPRELLNRWIMPMEGGIDQLTFQSGESIQVPFNLMVVFSTNLAPADLGDEAFLRRIRHKVLVPNPQRDHYLTILRTVCDRARVRFEEEGASYLIEEFYDRIDREFRGCHPGDIVQTIVDIAGFREVEPLLDRDQLAAACASYFVEPKPAT